ncbi:MAG: hypothetical protein J0L96_18450 [Anaerolineae bacterium]|nr:hypothetical protein [Anaerolineae bacterium]
MSRQIPGWAKNLGKYGFFIFIGSVFIKYITEIIFQLEIENWWTTNAKPWLSSKEVIEFGLFRWQILLICFIFLMITLSIPFLFRLVSGHKDPLEQFKRVGIPQKKGDASLNTSDIISAIVSTRKGQMEPEVLAALVISAINSSLINKETAVKTLTEFKYNLIYLGDGKYTHSKLGDINE